MRNVFLLNLTVACMSWVAVAQCEKQPTVPVTNAPFSALRRVITTVRKSDGTKSRSEATEQEARDSKGRMYRAGERFWTTTIEGKSVEKSEMLISIDDPIANTETKWDTSSKVVKIIHLPPSRAVTSAENPGVNAFSFGAIASGLDGKNLGARTIEGLSVEGIGYQTDKSTHECWFSRDLKTVVLQTDENPDRSFTNRLENIQLGEPDVSRYTPPSGYSANHIHMD